MPVELPGNSERQLNPSANTMTDPTPLRADDPRALAVTIAIETGDVASLRRLLEAQPQIVHTWIAKKDGGPRTPVFIAVDWPGHFPNVAETITTLAAAGADVNLHYPPHATDPNCMETLCIRRPAATMSPRSTRCSTLAPTSTPPVRCSPAVGHSPMRSSSRTGPRHGGWSNGALASSGGRQRR